VSPAPLDYAEVLFAKIEKQYEVARINYATQFLLLYVAYNAWYYQVTGTHNDREALALLKRRHVIWHDYYWGRTMSALRLYMQQLAELTQREPYESVTNAWNGEVKHSTDWRSLIEFWYQVRCALVHGSEVKPDYVGLAYQTLDIFMEEIIQRMKTHQVKETIRNLPNQGSSTHSVWHVDMQYV
jgi:hypothetical protein